MELLATGAEYLELPNAYVIFICDFDPFYLGKYRYTFRTMCHEAPTLHLKDGSETIFLNTKGKNHEEVPSELVKFLQYVGADLARSTEDFGNSFVAQLQQSVSDIKNSRGLEERYMLTELLMQDERRAGRLEERKESILELLSEIGIVTDELHDRIMQETDMNKLKTWRKLIVRVHSIEQFVEKM